MTNPQNTATEVDTKETLKSQYSPRKLFRLAYTPRCPYTHAELIEEACRINPRQSGEVQLYLPMDLKPESEDNLAELQISKDGGIYTLSVINSPDSTGVILEDLLMKMATTARLSTSPYMILNTQDGALATIVDHTIRGRRRVVLEMIPLANFLPATESTYSCEQIAEVILKHSTTPKLDCINLFERLYFSWIVGDCQYNVEQLKFVKSLDNFLTLAPLTHLTSATLLRSSKESHEVSISINGKHEELSSDDFVESMLNCGLDRKIVDNVIKKFSTLTDPWCDLIEESNLSEELSEEFKFMLFIKLT